MQDLQAYITPWNIAGAVAGLVLAVALVVALFLGRKQVAAWLKAISDRMFSQMGFFSIVIIVFMAISVLESGDFFNTNITHGAILGLLGYALALGFDLVSVVCMQGRLNATRMHDDHGKLLNLVGVSICAAVSAFANACGSLQGYSAVNLDHTPGWMQSVAPWLGMIFPAMIIVLSMTSDHIVDHSTPAKGIDVDTFRGQEKKRVDMLRVRLDTEKEMLQLEADLSNLRHNRDQAKGRVQREWFFTKWLRPTAAPPLDTIKGQIGQAVTETRTALEQQIGQVAGQLTTLATQLNQQMNELSRGNAENLSTLSNMLGQQIADLSSISSENLSALSSKINQQVADLSNISSENLSTVRGQIDTLTDTVSARLSSLDGQLNGLGNQVNDHLSTIDSQMDALSVQIGEQRSNLDTLGNAVTGQFKSISGQMNTLATGSARPATNANGYQRAEQRSDADTGETDSAALGQRILAAFQQQGITTFNRQIANQLGCSPTSVGKWKTKFQREGLLPLDPGINELPTEMAETTN